jgi:hypothetical protein
VLLLSGLSALGDVSGLRVAAIIVTDNGSRALIETEDGEQNWYRPGDRVAAATIIFADERGITLQASDGSYRLPLKGEPARLSAAAGEEPAPPSRHQAKEFQVLGLISEINSVQQAPGESYEDATARTLNGALGLGGNARITAVGRVQVASAEEARRELQQQLGAQEGPVRVTLENDYLEDMYIMPQ